MELSHAALVFDMPMIVIIRNLLVKGKPPQYPILHQQQNPLLHHLQTRMLKPEYNRSKPIPLLPLSERWH
jgi:hypothetical protein